MGLLTRLLFLMHWARERAGNLAGLTGGIGTGLFDSPAASKLTLLVSEPWMEVYVLTWIISQINDL